MAKFDLDDPLADLLSDGSDDSFFDNPKAPAKRASAQKTPEKKTVNDLFGLDEQPKVVSRDNGDKHILDPKKPSQSSFASPLNTRPKTATKKISFEDDDNDILNTLGLDNKSKSDTKIDTKKSDASKKSSLMESILGPQKDKEDKKFLSLDDLLQESKALKKQEVPATVTQSASQLNSTEQKNSTTGFGIPSLEPAPREGRRGRPRTANVSDPLGLFETKTEPEPKPRRRDAKESQKPENNVEVILAPSEKEKKVEHASMDVPDWLGGAQISKTDLEKDKLPTASSENLHPTPIPNIVVQQSMDNLLTQQKLATSHIEYQNTSIALQQQESQLLMALQLKKYEDNMNDMQRKQQEVLVKQEQQFNTLLDKQFAKQQIMENNMRLQQERINNHIQMLINQPPVSSAVSTEELEKVQELKRTDIDEVTRQYEEIINHLKQRQHEELFLLEESYKKQISTLEQSMESVENHLKTEIDVLVQRNREKTDSLEEEYKNDIDKYKKKIEELHILHENEIKQMRENNNRVIEEIKYEYNTIIENLKSSKSMEHGLLQDANVYTQKLDTSLKLLDINSRNLLDIKEKVHGEYTVLSTAREESLKAKENEIDSMRIALENARESADQERAQLMSLVRNLEEKLAEHSLNSREERFALQQAAATLAARTSALDREAEFNRQSLEREREQLKTLRETILAEQEKSMQELTEEKLKLHSEKIKIQTASKLNQNYDTQKAKAEVEAAIQVAKEAAEMTDKERENLIRQTREVETLKRTLIDRESRLRNRERDLEIAMEQANRKSMLGEKALEDARMLQINYNDKLREIQAQVSSINIRERKLAEDKIAISKERLALHNNARQLRKCGLCAAESNPIIEEDNGDEAVEHDIPRFISVSDADIFRLQLQMSEEQLSTAHDDEIHMLK